MKYSAIKRKYKNQWVLLECTKTTDDYNILEAEVLAHSKRKKTVEDKMSSFMSQSKTLAIEYLGTVPKDIAYIF
ncbi:MAG: hypothetical protein HY960_06835 [Ignavibacteriae bacterium]|nr:hypothetical protein [Ignavibacteriota bacterium]